LLMLAVRLLLGSLSSATDITVVDVEVAPVDVACVDCFLIDAVSSVKLPVSCASEVPDFDLLECTLLVSASGDTVYEDFVLLVVCGADCVSPELSSLVAGLGFGVDAESVSIGPVSEDVSWIAFCLTEDAVSEPSVISLVCGLLVLVLGCNDVEESIRRQ
jgi:hypothetical protein